MADSTLSSATDASTQQHRYHRTPTLREVIEVMEELWPLSLAEPWDASGVVTGRVEQPVRRVHWAVDPVQAVVDEAVAAGADLLITHHPLLLKAVHSVAADQFKGKVVHTLIEGGCALITAHTNADSAVGGVSDVMAEILGLQHVVPLAPAEKGQSVNGEGMGRVGMLPQPLRLEDFAARVFSALPAVATGVRVAGDRNGVVRTVAVTGGAGDSLFDQVRAHHADVYVTADLRHHPASEARERAALEGDRPYLVDVSHFASEWLFLPAAAQALQRGLAEHGWTIETGVSALNTDPWDFVITAGRN
ncbi:Nif3-like dinuclear metal center hexameric protein [Auritidibacter ignavus]|uniref:Nif3-like dinuclear metal center hexameric protein n=1 Tax=Auritidibacter ignavus TaxID=678932 RepID=UPI00109D0B0B|nr:Nif3-like dinuclear metal center hexameric protein [Auritidibacter ignavus]